jgi:pseudomonalisin/xanthomonalisin
VPDVSDLAGDEDGDGYFIYIDGEPASEGGTSLASPLMMGQWARIQAAAPARVQAKGGLGFADPLIYKQASSADKCSAAPCSGTYARDFFNITHSEDIGDTGGFVGAPVSTGIDIGNGAYAPGPGWSYASGWGSINVGNFAQDVDGSIRAADRYSGAERAAPEVCKATMFSPAGNATDPVDVSLGDSPGADLTQATLSSPNAKTITATLKVPDLSAGPSLDATAGITFYVAWEFKGLVYYAQATEASKGSWTFSTGNTGPFEVGGETRGGSYTDLSKSTATGHVDTASGVITINVPTIDVGSPKARALLTDPQAFDQTELGVPGVDTIALTIDSADSRRAYSLDDGQLDSIGAAVVVGGKGCTNRLPRTTLRTAETGVLGRK